MTVLSRNGAAISVYPTSLAVSSGDSFDIDFEFGSNPTYIMAFIRHTSGEISNLTLYTDYDVSVAESPGYNNSWGTLTIKNDYQNCSALCLYRKIENSQDVAYSSQTIFATTTEEALDKLTMLVQDEDYGARAITAPMDDLLNPSDLELPNRELRANSVIVFDETGNILTRPISEAFIDIVDNLDSTDRDKALSANMGHELNGKIITLDELVGNLGPKITAGTGITITQENQISANIATTSTPGIVKPGTNITIDESGVITANLTEIEANINDLKSDIELLNNKTAYLENLISSIEISLANKQDIISAGQGIQIIDGKIINVDIATKDKVGIVKPGNNITIDSDGTINVDLPGSYSVTEVQTAVKTSSSSLNLQYKICVSGSNILLFVSNGSIMSRYKSTNFENFTEISGFACSELDSISVFNNYQIWKNDNIWRENITTTQRAALDDLIKSAAPEGITVYIIETAFQAEGGFYSLILDSNSRTYKLLFYNDMITASSVVIPDLGAQSPDIRFYYSLDEKVLYCWWSNNASHSKYLTMISHENPDSPQILKTYDYADFPITPNVYVFSYKQGIIADESIGYLVSLTDVVNTEKLQIQGTPAFGVYVDNGEIIALDWSNELIGINSSATQSVATLPLKNTGGTANNFQAIKFNGEIYITNYLFSSSGSRIEYRKIIKL